MRIDKVEIDGFGKLNHVSLSFGEDFNVILGDNESGKSTLCDFLLAMFYEIPNEGKRIELKDSIRGKYRPWKGESFGGRVYFTDDSGKQYVLEKSIGTTKRSDKVKLLYADTWDAAGDGENAGERFFGFGREGFLKTLYLKSLDLSANGASEILEKLSNMETSGDEDVSYETIKSSLEKAQNALRSKTGKGGSISKLEADLDAFKLEKQQFLYTRERLKTEEETLKTLEADSAKLEEKRKELEKNYALSVAHDSYLSLQREEEGRRALKTRLAQEEKQVLALKEKLETLGEEDTSSKEEVLNRAKELETKLLFLKSRQEEYENEARLEKARLEQEAKRKQRTRLFVSVGILCVLLIIGIPMILVSKIAGIALALFGVFGAVSSYIILGRQSTVAEDTVKAERYKEEYETCEKELSALLKTAGAETVNELYADVVSGKNAEKTKAELLLEIDTKQKQIAELKESLHEIHPKEETSFTEEEMKYTGPDAKTIRASIEALLQKQESIKTQFYNLSVTLAKETAEERTLADIESDIFTVEEKLKEQRTQFAAFLKAGEWLEKAHGEIRSNFAPRLNKETAEIFSRLTDGKYQEVRVGEEFLVNFKNESGEIVEADFLSSGTYDLLYVALRFATLRTLSDMTRPMLVADDAFLQLDDARIKCAIEFLLESETFGQVLYFTCHRESASLFKNEKIHLIDLNQDGTFEKRA